MALTPGMDGYAAPGDEGYYTSDSYSKEVLPSLYAKYGIPDSVRTRDASTIYAREMAGADGTMGLYGKIDSPDHYSAQNFYNDAGGQGMTDFRTSALSRIISGPDGGYYSPVQDLAYTQEANKPYARVSGNDFISKMIEGFIVPALQFSGFAPALMSGLGAFAPAGEAAAGGAAGAIPAGFDFASTYAATPGFGGGAASGLGLADIGAGSLLGSGTGIAPALAGMSPELIAQLQALGYSGADLTAAGANAMGGFSGLDAAGIGGAGPAAAAGGGGIQEILQKLLGGGGTSPASSAGSFMSRLSTDPLGTIGKSLIGNPASTASSLYSMINSRKLKQMGQQQGIDQTTGMSNTLLADPQAPYRAGYAKQLNDLATNPSSITKDPGYEAGMQAVQRSMASQGYNGSGNMAMAMAKYGGDFYNNAIARLNTLAGGSPSAAAQISNQSNLGGLNATTSGINLMGQALNRLGYLFNS